MQNLVRKAMEFIATKKPNISAYKRYKTPRDEMLLVYYAIIAAVAYYFINIGMIEVGLVAAIVSFILTHAFDRWVTAIIIKEDEINSILKATREVEWVGENRKTDDYL